MHKGDSAQYPQPSGAACPRGPRGIGPPSHDEGERGHMDDGPQYWLDLFTAKSWQEFLDAGGVTSGFSASRWSTVQRIKPGDYLLGYLTGISRFIGVLEVVTSPFQDNAPIWSDAEFPSRVRVKVLHALTPATAVPVLELRADLSVFQGLSNPNYWSGAFRGSPALWTPDDGRIVVAAVEQAVRDPLERPVDNAKLGHRPKTFRTSIGDVTLPEKEDPSAEDQPKMMTPTTLPDVSVEPAEAVTAEASAHTEIQGLLLRMGSAMGLGVWVARNDRNRLWEGRPFSETFKLRAELPHNFDTTTSRVIEMIDVLWLEGNAIRAAFEIESTTSIYSGLLRMSDLVAMQPNLQIPLFLVAPDDRRSKVITEVNRPTFASMSQPLVKVCRFISFSALRSHDKHARPYMRYLKPEVLQELSEACDGEEAS